MYIGDDRIAELREKYSEPKEFPICDICKKSTAGKYVLKVGGYVVCEDCYEENKEYMEEEY